MSDYLIIDHNILLPNAASKLYGEKYNTVPKDELTPEGRKICEAFGMDVAPLTVLSDQGVFAKVLPAFVYPGPTGVLMLSWVMGVEIPLSPDQFRTRTDVYEPEDKPAVKVIVVTCPDDVEIGFTYRKETPFKGTGEKAEKLSQLDVGDYQLKAVKLVECTFNGKKQSKPIIVVSGPGFENGKEFWPNTQLTQILSISALLPAKANETRTLEKPKGLKITSRGTTSAGHPYVKVGLFDLALAQ